CNARRAHLRGREHDRELGAAGAVPATEEDRGQAALAVERGRAPSCGNETNLGIGRRGAEDNGGDPCGSERVTLSVAALPKSFGPIWRARSTMRSRSPRALATATCSALRSGPTRWEPIRLTLSGRRSCKPSLTASPIGRHSKRTHRRHSRRSRNGHSCATSWPIRLRWARRPQAGLVPMSHGPMNRSSSPIACRPHLARVIALASNTGQRGSDLVKMRWSDIEEYEGRPGINVTQKKTGLAMWIPFTQELIKAIAAWERRPTFILLKEDGLPFTRAQLSDQWLRERDTRPALAPLKEAG